MKKLPVIILFLFASTIHSWGSHIVGGELELAQRRGNVYQIILKMYVDDLNADPGVIASEVEAQVGIFDKATNFRLDVVTVKRNINKVIDYGSVCAVSPIPQVKTRLLIFYGDVMLDPGTYYKSTGYYLAWENCCRNGVIENIVGPYTEGMVFYLEFPAVTKSGLAFNNSSPHFKDLKGDYPCLNKKFTMDFSGSDVNGDSLVYSLVTPMAGHATANGNSSGPMSAPYDSITWEPGYNRLNQIPGNPPFDINHQTGEIFFTANLQGLFVFGVKVDEYRNGVKIGSVRRDFQLRVVACEQNASNAIDLKFANGTLYDSQTDTLTIDLAKDTCFNVLFSDSSTIKFNKTERLSLFVFKNNLPKGIMTYPSSVYVSPGNDTTSSNVCFNACNKLFITKDTVFNISIAITDGPKCPLSLAYWDTLNLVIKYKPEVNAKPTMGVIPAVTTFNATIGKQLSFDVWGKDTDLGDIVSLTGQGLGFNLSDKGMLFNNVIGPDSVGSKFRWTPLCKDLEEDRLKIRFIVKDNSCIPQNKDTIDVEILVHDTLTAIASINPTNLFTPNGDDLNDVFEIHDIPEGNCQHYFKKISIYNRWGARVYENADPHFQWTGEKNPSGLYFYIIDINNKEIKGWVEMVR